MLDVCRFSITRRVLVEHGLDFGQAVGQPPHRLLAVTVVGLRGDGDGGQFRFDVGASLTTDGNYSESPA